jgi:hypothetical protein
MRRIHLGSLAATSIAFVAVFLSGSAHAQVIQLPTFRFFGLSTTVSVPDRGSAYLGGVSRSAMSRSERGLPILSRVPVAGRAFGNRAIAGRTDLSGASVSAYIHDFEAMDEELLGQAAAAARRSTSAVRRQPGNANVTARSATPPRSLPSGQISDAAGRTSVADLRRQQQIQKHASQTEANLAARRDIERAKELMASGKSGLARMYLQQAAKQADPQLRTEIAAMFNNLSAQSAHNQVPSKPSNSLASRVR